MAAAALAGVKLATTFAMQPGTLEDVPQLGTPGVVGCTKVGSELKTFPAPKLKEGELIVCVNEPVALHPKFWKIELVASTVLAENTNAGFDRSP